MNQNKLWMINFLMLVIVYFVGGYCLKVANLAVVFLSVRDGLSCAINYLNGFLKMCPILNNRL